MKTKISLIIIVLFITAMFSCSNRIDAGYEGTLVKQYGTDKGVQDIALVTGRVWYNPFTEDVFETPLFVQTVDYELFDINAKDGSSFKIDPTISLYVITGQSPFIIKKYRKHLDEIIQTTIYNYVKNAFRIQMNQYTTEEIVSNRKKFEDDVEKLLTNQLEKEGFHLEQLTSGLRYPETIVTAINDKNKAIQDAQKEVNNLVIAENKAKIRLVNSKAYADALIIEAQGQAKANQLMNQTLTPLLISQKFVEKWDGKTALYGQSPMLFKNVN